MKKQSISNKCKLMLTSVLVLTAVAIGGCASQPNKDEIQALPVIQLGDVVPANGRYILYLPAGKAISSTTEISGDVFQQQASKSLSVKLKRGIYSYKNWLSYDKISWLSDKEVLDIRLSLRLPSYYYPNPGKISLQVFEKNK